MSTVARVACRALQPAVQRTGRARRRARPKLQSLPEPSKPVVTGSNIAGSGWQRAGRSPRQFQVILCGVLPAHAICAEAEEDDPTIAEASCRPRQELATPPRTSESWLVSMYGCVHRSPRAEQLACRKRLSSLRPLPTGSSTTGLSFCTPACLSEALPANPPRAP